jgi:two-component system cell cycle sensor histidine kinase/response regulator CckA
MPKQNKKKQNRILIVEDDDGLRELIARRLSKSGYKTAEAADGLSALNLVETLCPDALLLDQSLPDMTGRQIVEALSERDSHLPFIVMTGQGDERLAVTMMKLGAADYLIKDREFLDILPMAVERLFKSIEMERELLETRINLQKSEELLNDTQRLARVGGWEWDLEKQIMTWTRETYRIHGIKPEENITGSPASIDFSLNCYDPSDRPVIEAAFKNCVVNGQSYDMEFPLNPVNGGRIWIRTMGQAEKRNNQIIRIIGNIIDISERKQTEEKMRFLSAVTENMNESVIVTDTEGRINYINKGAQKLFGYTLDELSGKGPDLFNCDPEAETIQKTLYETVALGETYHGEALNRKKDGTEFICEFTITPLTDDNGLISSYIGLQRDITESRNLENVAIRQERLSAIGELASGVAHDFNNVLQIILGGVEMAMVSDNPGEIRQYLDSIKKSTGDAASRVRQLQRFAQKSQSQKETVPININKLTEDVIKEVKLLLNQYQERGIHITLKSDYQSKKNIEGNEGELRTCLVNLVKNSAEAMPDGGRITISTGEYCSQVYVRVADTGTGMDWETQKKIFQPFYSTKGFESGRGLGMAQVYSTIRDHNGDVYIKESEVGKGTVMEFTLPCTGKKEIPERKSASAAGSARILWVDDEEMIRLLGKSMLKTLGHDADMASSGAEALEYLAKGNEYDLVITDVGMPEMSGWQLAEKIKSEGYTTKMAVLTGWGSEISQEDKDRYNVAYVLGKPVALKDLKALINDVLGGKAD